MSITAVKMSRDEPFGQFRNNENSFCRDQLGMKQARKMSPRVLLAFVSICFLTLMVALDSTSISVVLFSSLVAIKADLVEINL